MQIFSFIKIHLKLLSDKWQSLCLILSVFLVIELMEEDHAAKASSTLNAENLANNEELQIIQLWRLMNNMILLSVNNETSHI